MKSVLLTAIAAIAVALLLIAEGVLYPATLVVTDVIEGGSEANDLVTAQTVGGIVYKFHADDLNEGDLVSVIMYSNLTKLIYDDLVISSRYACYFN